MLPAISTGVESRVPLRLAAGHNLILMAGLAQMELPVELTAYAEAPLPPGIPRAVGQSQPLAAVRLQGSRWSADGWLFVRGQSEAPVTPGQPSYGRSQAGAVIRYRLSEGGIKPQAYLRGSLALAGPRDREAAIGLSARLIPGLPVRFAAEGRVTGTGQGAEVRPAAYAVTEFAPIALPFDASAEIYAQAGWAGGHYATPFVDGQARVDRPLVHIGTSEVSAGAGVWGGAQKGAARLDFGPTARVSFRLGDGQGRVAADYRFRVAGDAQPSNGPALTLSAGF